MKKLFYWWAYVDYEHKCDKKKTYIYEHSHELAIVNLNMVKSLSMFISIIGIAVIIMALTFFNAPLLAEIYVGIILLELLFYACTFLATKSTKCVVLSRIISMVYLFHMLMFGAIIGTIFSNNECALVYVVVLVISQMLFIEIPLITTPMAFISMLITLHLSNLVKPEIYFKSDIINCVGVFILSILLGWRIIKIRIEEADSRNKAQMLSAQLEKLSMVDQLTNLWNHRSFQNKYYDLFEKMGKTNEDIGIIMMDIDKFKYFNDGYGHLEGDKCLNKIGECFGKLQTDSIMPFRFGGEEFVLIIVGDECKNIKGIAEKVRMSVEKLGIPHEYSPVSNVVTISLGYYLGKPSNMTTPTQLIDYADQALYKSKRSGGNMVSSAD